MAAIPRRPPETLQRHAPRVDGCPREGCGGACSGRTRIAILIVLLILAGLVTATVQITEGCRRRESEELERRLSERLGPEVNRWATEAMAAYGRIAATDLSSLSPPYVRGRVIVVKNIGIAGQGWEIAHATSLLPGDLRGDDPSGVGTVACIRSYRLEKGIEVYEWPLARDLVVYDRIERRVVAVKSLIGREGGNPTADWPVRDPYNAIKVEEIEDYLASLPRRAQ